MPEQENKSLANTFEQGKFSEDHSASPEIQDDNKDDVVPAERDDQLTAGKGTPEITTDDGSVIETLDTAFHGKPGWSEGENPSGSNRADYYEARSYGKSDAEEELDDLRERNKSRKDNNGSE
jgi:hypothetical protein